jgi:hypothetical protein
MFFRLFITLINFIPIKFSINHVQVVIPTTIAFVALHARSDLSQLSLSDPDSSPAFDW